MDAINPDVRARVIAAADQLYAAGGRADFPPVDAVRRAARADMNSTSAVMKEWRRIQTAQPATVAVAIPERVQQAHQTALVELWTAAQELANEALTVARQAWEAERAEADALRGELSQAFEAQADELAAAQARIAELEAAAQRSMLESSELRADLGMAQEMAHTANTRAAEIERRVEDLRVELDRAHRENAAQRDAMAEQQRSAQALASERDQVRAELAAASAQTEAVTNESARLADRMAAVEAERDAARKEAAQAREEAARLAGRLEALSEQNAALFATLKTQDMAQVKVTPEKPARKPRAGKTDE